MRIFCGITTLLTGMVLGINAYNDRYWLILVPGIIVAFTGLRVLLAGRN